MIGTESFVLMRPLWLLAPLAVLAILWLVKARGALGDWRRAVDGPLLSALIARGAAVGDEAKRRRMPASALAAVVLALALAGPAVERNDVVSYRNLDGVLIAMDVSRSMVEGAMGEMRVAARQVVEAAGSRQGALLLYAGDAYLAAPFTSDKAAMAELVASVGPDLVPDPGSDPVRAIAYGEKTFAAAEIRTGDLVLVTDGGGIGPAAIDAARSLKAAGHRVDVVYVEPMLPPGTAPAADRDAAARLAAAGGGGLADAADAEAIPALLAQSTSERLARSDLSVLAWTDYGRYAAALAGVPILLLFRRRR